MNEKLNKLLNAVEAMKLNALEHGGNYVVPDMFITAVVKAYDEYEEHIVFHGAELT